MRLEDDIPLLPRQKAFRRGDGLTDNVCILRVALRDRTQNHRPIFVTFVDVAKAFDSVSHEYDKGCGTSRCPGGTASVY